MMSENSLMRKAEVSTEAEVSLEEEDNESDLYDDSFIDDRINPTGGGTQVESGRVDMMAIYRRSLLSQSPMVRQPTPAFSPVCVASTSKDIGSGCSSYNTLHPLQASQPESINQPAGKNTEERICSVSMPWRTHGSEVENESLQSRKRKLSFFQLEFIPAINLEQEFKSEVVGKGSSNNASRQPQVNNGNDDDFDDDDQFYASLDLDVVEAQATMLLKNKSEPSLEKQELTGGQPNSNLQNGGVQAPPSFDLGIW